MLWEAGDRICGKRLKPLIPLLIPAMERHGHLVLDETVRLRLCEISAATIDRVLAPVRAGASGGRRRRNTYSSAVRRSVPIRTFADWNDPVPGYMEADLVAHSGPSASGSFVQTLTLTDVATGWTECAALLFREQRLLSEVMTALRPALPFPLLGFDTDNDSVFMNQTIKDWPIDQTLIISAGVQPGILLPNKKGFLNLRLPGTVPNQTELLVFLEAKAQDRGRPSSRD